MTFRVCERFGELHSAFSALGIQGVFGRIRDDAGNSWVAIERVTRIPSARSGSFGCWTRNGQN